jgi:disulfide bond formation protein DsbB
VLNTLTIVSTSRWYWLAVLLLGACMEAAALYFQYVRDYPPCMLCIHVRVLVAGLMLVALLGIVLGRARAGAVVTHLLATGLLAGLVHRAWLLFGTERGFVIGDCGFDLRLPAWLPLDTWFPVMFQALEPCGYTPPMPLGFTMAEVLLVLSIGLLLLSLAVLLTALWSLRGPRR